MPSDEWVRITHKLSDHFNIEKVMLADSVVGVSGDGWALVDTRNTDTRNTWWVSRDGYPPGSVTGPPTPCSSLTP